MAHPAAGPGRPAVALAHHPPRRPGSASFTPGPAPCRSWVSPPASSCRDLLLGTSAALAGDVLAVAREAQPRWPGRARATAGEISLATGELLITLVVTDNGRGPGSRARSSGQARVRRRAERNGGTLEFATPPGGGTRRTWPRGSRALAPTDLKG